MQAIVLPLAPSLAGPLGSCRRAGGQRPRRIGLGADVAHLEVDSPVAVTGRSVKCRVQRAISGEPCDAKLASPNGVHRPANTMAVRFVPRWP